MDVFQHMSDVDIHLVNVRDLTLFHWKLADTLRVSLPVFSTCCLLEAVVTSMSSGVF